MDALDVIKKGGSRKKGKGKKGRKIGRSNRHPAAQRYKSEKRWIKNRHNRIEKHLKRFPDDKQALAAI